MCCCCIVRAVCDIPIAHICDNCYRIDAIGDVNVRPIAEPHHKASVNLDIWSVAEMNIPLAITHNNVSVSSTNHGATQSLANCTPCCQCLHMLTYNQSLRVVLGM